MGFNNILVSPFSSNKGNSSAALHALTKTCLHLYPANRKFELRAFSLLLRKTNDDLAMLSSERMLHSSKQHVSMENVDKLWLSVTVLTFTLPITVVTLCYVWIFKVARKQARETTREIVKTPTKTVLPFVLRKITGSSSV